MLLIGTAFALGLGCLVFALLYFRERQHSAELARLGERASVIMSAQKRHIDALNERITAFVERYDRRAPKGEPGSGVRPGLS